MSEVRAHFHQLFQCESTRSVDGKTDEQNRQITTLFLKLVVIAHNLPPPLGVGKRNAEVGIVSQRRADFVCKFEGVGSELHSFEFHEGELREQFDIFDGAELRQCTLQEISAHIFGDSANPNFSYDDITGFVTIIFEIFVGFGWRIANLHR